MAETKYYDVHPETLSAWLAKQGAALVGVNAAQQRVYRSATGTFVLMGRVKGYVRVKVTGRCAC